MATVRFSRAFERHVACPGAEIDGDTVGGVLARYFDEHPAVRGYVLDEHGRVRKHVVVYVDDTPIADRSRLTDPVGAHQTLHVLQALSGG